jgi:hypothetical protein
VGAAGSSERMVTTYETAGNHNPESYIPPQKYHISHNIDIAHILSLSSDVTTIFVQICSICENKLIKYILLSFRQETS